MQIFTVRKRSCGKVMFSQACVKNCVHWGRHMVYTPLQQTPHPGQTPPPEQTPPWVDPPPSRQLLQRTVRILLECILVSYESDAKSVKRTNVNPAVNPQILHEIL